MNSPKPFAIILFSFAIAFFCPLLESVSAHPEPSAIANRISTAKIRKDIIGKTIRGVPWAATNGDQINWTFERSDQTEIGNPKEQLDNAGDVYVTLNILTRKPARGNDATWKMLRGEISLRYMRQPGSWFLERIRNKNSKYQVFSSANEELSAVLFSNSYTMSAREYGAEPFRLSGPAIVLANIKVSGGSRDVWVYIVRNKQRLYQYNTKPVGGNLDIRLELDAGAYDLELDNRHSATTDKYVAVSLKALYK